MNLKNILISRPEYQKSLFTKAVGRNGKNYYYNANPSSVWVDGDGSGMGGRTVTYEMMDGDVESLKGPWNTNTHDLFEQTGVDLTRNFFSFGAIIESQDLEKFEKGEDVEFIFSDNDWTKGEYDGAVKRMRERIMDVGLEFNSNLLIVFINYNGAVSYAKN